MQLLLPMISVLTLLQDIQENVICTLNVVSRLNVKNVYLLTDIDFLVSELFSHGVSIQTLIDFEGEYHKSNTFILSVKNNSFYENFVKPVDHNAKYIVILLSAKLKINIVMEKFWSHNVYDVTVIFKGVVYLSLPSDCSSNLRIIKTYKCNAKTIHFKRNKYRNCPLRINWVNTEPYFIGSPSDGIEYLLLLVVAQVMKKDIIWYNEEFKGYFKNGTWIGALANVKDIAGGDYIMSENLYKHFLLTYPHFYDSYRWYIPLTNHKTTLKQFYVLSLGNYILLFLYISICFFVMSTNDKTYSSPFKCSLNVFRIGLGQSIRKTPKFTHMRILFISWVVFQMHTSIIYSGNLTQQLTQKFTPLPITTNLEEKRCISPNLAYLNDYNFVEECDLLKNIRRMEYYKNFTLLASEEIVNYIIKKYKVLLGYNGPRYFMRYNTFIIPKNSLYYGQINKIIGRSFETGLIIKMYNDIYYHYPDENLEIQQEVDLALLYLMLCTGWILSLMALIGEFTICNFKMRFRRSIMTINLEC